jgi:hypothetical protein
MPDAWEAPCLSRNVSSMAQLNIYEVIFWEGDGEPDTIYIVTAHSHLEAVDLAQRAPQFGRGKSGFNAKAGAVCLIGESRIASVEPQIIRGPFREMGVTRGETWLYDSEHKKWFTHEDYYKPRS